MTEENRNALPQAFAERMKRMLQEESETFFEAYEGERWYGLRLNPLKTDRETFLKRMPFLLDPVKWSEEGFYYRPEQQPGKSLFHEIGAYYIQEPSAMAAVEVLSPAPGERILDLCAAPGGKSTQIAGKMRGEGLLVSNEIVPGRAKILSQNIERMGIANAVVCNEAPDRLAFFFPSFFDKILVDAPCSGEGMFRKDETAVNEWSPEHVGMCAKRQRMILEQAVFMLKPGGTLVYSTCTFSAEENEGVIGGFLKEHPELSIEEAAQEKFFAPGRSDWTEEPADGIGHTMRLWPHKLAGEGHFIAKLKKAGTLQREKDEGRSAVRRKGTGAAGSRKGADAAALCRAFLREELGMTDKACKELEERGVFLPFGEQIYLVPRQMIPLKGLKVIRPGLHLGTNKKNRFEPSHALALYLSEDAVRARYEMTNEQAERYLRGEAFAYGSAPTGKMPEGWTLLTVGGYAAGFGKAGNGQMKNHYPKGLRKERTIL
ncbi:MAG: RsmF rRNA methyltransferase first C-terminal domain-containing protein [Blautia sp.]|nr:RsmF rRNA methyltransferase first C-terminal domain-containing protein [Blautia sp.]MCM1201684.1 RsmF rRNA methyltransferase first C-terminal domain-containing protein [Bacteroides fragilis]